MEHSSDEGDQYQLVVLSSCILFPFFMIIEMSFDACLLDKSDMIIINLFGTIVPNLSSVFIQLFSCDIVCKLI